MREILFRGKSLLNKDKEWIYGSLIHNYPQGCYISVFDMFTDIQKEYPVFSPTIGQFTGLLDKNGNKIFEGDIVKTESDKPMVVSWNIKFASFCLDRNGRSFSHWFGESTDPAKCEVIGNIHD